MRRQPVVHNLRLRLRRRVLQTTAVLALTLALIVVGIVPAAAQNGSNSLGISISFPDDGLHEGEQLCLALYPDDTEDFSVPPLQSRCLDPGDDLALFEGLWPGTYQLISPSVGSILEPNRYQAQSAETSVPEESANGSFLAEFPLSLTPEMAGTTGQVQVNVFGCPPGTDGQGDATLWASQCQSPVAGVSVALQGIGSIEDTTAEAVTADQLASAGKVEFTNLPPGEYQITGVDGAQYTNVENNPALFVESNIDGRLGPVDPSEGISLRPSEIKSINVFLVLQDEPKPMVISPVPSSVAIGAANGSFTSGNPSTASPVLNPAALNPSPEVSGGLSAAEAAERAAEAEPTPDT